MSKRFRRFIWNGTKKNFLEGFFYNFLGINPHNFVKNDPKFENKSLFDSKFYGAWHEKIFRSQSSDIWNGTKKKISRFWSLKVSLGQFEPKAFGKGLIKPLVENPTSNFHKQDLENYEMNPIKSWNFKIFIEPGVWGLETTFGVIGLRRRIQP